MNKDDELMFQKVPSDFPRYTSAATVPGNQPKFVATNYQGRFYLAGCTPPEIYERWQICEEIAQQLAVKSRESKAGKRSHMSESAILEQYSFRLIQTDLISEAEAMWVITRVARIVEWPCPYPYTEES